ncbi:MAG: hypothetical protein Tsb0015_02430 [Simkaniaceae bacterium]
MIVPKKLSPIIPIIDVIVGIVEMCGSSKNKKKGSKHKVEKMICIVGATKKGSPIKNLLEYSIPIA